MYCDPQSPPELPLLKLNTKEGEIDAYATSDLVIPHKTVPRLWKIVGRLDEQIILSNGEKVRFHHILCIMYFLILICAIISRPTLFHLVRIHRRYRTKHWADRI